MVDAHVTGACSGPNKCAPLCHDHNIILDDRNDHYHDHRMRRAQTVRHQSRPSIALGADEIALLREGEETVEDVLRRQLLEKDLENDKFLLSPCTPSPPHHSDVIWSFPFEISWSRFAKAAQNDNPNTSRRARTAPASGDCASHRTRVQDPGAVIAMNAEGERAVHV